MIKNIFNGIASFEALLKAEHDCGKTGSGNVKKREMLLFRQNLEEHLHEDSEMLLSGIFPDITYRSFIAYDPKVRKIIYADYNSKVIERSIYNALNPIISKGFIDDTYSCVEGRGQLRAMQRLYQWFQLLSRKPGKWYYYKLDVAKFFYRIPHDVLINDVCGKKISDKMVLKAIDYYICNGKQPFGLQLTDDPLTTPLENMLYDVGIPIGGGLSHTLGNMTLDVVDQFAKRELRLKYYIRYMDDIIFLGNDKNKMHEQKRLIEDLLNRRLRLQLNNKTALCPIERGCEFVGNRIYPDHVILRKQTTLRMKRRLRYLQKEYEKGKVTLDKITETVASYKALLKYVDCRNFNVKLWDDFILTRKHGRGEVNIEL